MANISIIGWFTKYYFGNSNSNDLYGSDLYGDRMYGRGGDDTFHSSLGPDYFNGGTGFDTVDYSDSDSAVDVRLYRGKGYGGDAQGDTYYGIEGLVGSNYGDNLHGNFANNTLDGGDGVDSLYGYSGNDIFIQRAEVGSDYFYGGSGVDTVDYSNVELDIADGVTVDFRLGRGFTYDESNDVLLRTDTYFSIENAIGTYGDDVFSGRDNTNNTLYGRDGDDLFRSSSGNNHYDGGEGNDKINYYHSASGVTINLETGDASRGDANGDTFVGIENITGSRYNDVLYGDNNNNKLNGGAGNDRLNGGRGDDTLSGGDGRDTFIFETGDGKDVIYWFSGRNDDGDRDRIDLEDYGINGWGDLTNGGSRGMREFDDYTGIYNENGDTIRLVGVEIDDLNSNDFIF